MAPFPKYQTNNTKRRHMILSKKQRKLFLDVFDERKFRCIFVLLSSGLSKTPYSDRTPSKSDNLCFRTRRSKLILTAAHMYIKVGVNMRTAKSVAGPGAAVHPFFVLQLSIWLQRIFLLNICLLPRYCFKTYFDVESFKAIPAAESVPAG